MKTTSILGLVFGSLMAMGCASEGAIEPEDTFTESDDAVSETANIEVLFGTPKGDGAEDLTLENKLVELIGLAAPGATIRGSYFHFTRIRVAQALLAAAARGANVRMAFNAPSGRTDSEDPEKDTDGAITALQNGLGAGGVIICTRGQGSCIGDGIDHNKFLIISALADGTQNVVVQASANIASSKMHNNMVIVRGDKPFFDGYSAYFDALATQEKNLNYYRVIGGNGVRSYVYPRSSGDTVISALENVRCKRGESSIRVAMAFFTEARAGVAQKLVQLQKEGCDVRVAMRKAGKASDQSIIDRLARGGVDVGLYPEETGNNIHSKYLLIDSDYQGATGAPTRMRLVFTGSHNYTGGALLHNDEVLMRVQNDAAFNGFTENWNTIRSQIVGSAK